MKVKNKAIWTTLLILVLNVYCTSALGQTGQDVKQLYDEALMLGLEGHFFDAKDVLSQALTDAPDNIHAKMLLRIAIDVNTGVIPVDVGKTLFSSVHAGNSGEWNEAMTSAQRIVEMAPGYAPGYLHLGTVYAKLSEMGKEDVENARSAIKAYKKALEIDSTFGLAHYNLGVCYAFFKKWKLAQKHLSLASSLGVAVPQEFTSRIEKARGGFFSGPFAPLSFIVRAIEFIGPSRGGRGIP